MLRQVFPMQTKDVNLFIFVPTIQHQVASISLQMFTIDMKW